MNYGQDALSSQLQTQIWEMDDADAPGITDPTSNNNGLFDRAALISESKTLDLHGPIYHDLFSMDRYLINQVDVKVKLYRTPPNFSLLAKDSSTDFRIKIEDIHILVKKIKVNPAVDFTVIL